MDRRVLNFLQQSRVRREICIRKEHETPRRRASRRNESDGEPWVVCSYGTRTHKDRVKARP